MPFASRESFVSPFLFYMLCIDYFLALLKLLEFPVGCMVISALSPVLREYDPVFHHQV